MVKEAGVDLLKRVNLGLAFVLELVMLVAFGYRAYFAAPGGWLSWLAALVIVAVAIGLWAIWGAPKSARRLKLRH